MPAPEPFQPEVAVADAHGDLLLEVEYRHRRANPFGELWLEQLRRGGVALQVCALWTGERQQPEGALRLALRQLLAAQRAVRQNPQLTLVTRAADLDAVEAGERIGIVLALEGAEPLGADPELIDVFWQLGVRVVGLTWALRNAFADGNAEPQQGGLSRRGEALVARLAELGAIVDLAHASARTFDDVLAAADERLAVLVSHAGCRALHDTPRNVSDAQLRAVRERGGVTGLMAHPLALGPGAPTRARLLDHVEHALAVAGPDGVCLGGDFARQVTRSGGLGLPWEDMRLDGTALDAAVEGAAGPADYPALLAELAARGHDAETVRRVAAGNLLALLRRALP